MTLMRLAALSLLSRRLTVGLTVLSIALSVALFMGVQKVNDGARETFADTISGTDLIVGARGGSVQILLYTVFHIGSPSNNIRWDSYAEIAGRDDVAWSVPISLGDSHRGFRVMGTTPAFLEHYRYRKDQTLAFAEGGPVADLFDAVIGAQVAEDLGYSVDDGVIISHGIASFVDHDALPFRVSGILARTGTPVDRTVIVGLDAIEAIHVDWQSGAQIPGQNTPADVLRQMDLTPKTITAALIGTHSPIQIFSLQRSVNEFPGEPLQAVMPGLALQELWSTIGIAEVALSGMSLMIIATTLVGMVATTFGLLEMRRREMSILRSVGAGPFHIAGLLLLECVLMAAVGIVLGVALLWLGLTIARPLIDAAFGLYLPGFAITLRDVLAGIGVLCAAVLAGCLPAIRAYRTSVADGMTIRS